MYQFYIPSYSCLSEIEDLSVDHVGDFMHAEDLWFDASRVHSLVNARDVGKVFNKLVVGIEISTGLFNIDLCDTIAYLLIWKLYIYSLLILIAKLLVEKSEKIL